MEAIYDFIEMFFTLDGYSLEMLYGYFYTFLSESVLPQNVVETMSANASSLMFVLLFIIWLIVFYQIIKFFIRKVVDLIC